MSETLSLELFTRAWEDLFDELYNGPRDFKRTWVTTNEPDASICGILKHVSAEKASQEVPSGQTIAMHIEHLRWSLALANSYLRDENPEPDWEESWKVKTVDAIAWHQLRSDLLSEARELQAAVSTRTNWDDRMLFTGALALLPHAAYHLGSIRQMLATVNVDGGKA